MRAHGHQETYSYLNRRIIELFPFPTRPACLRHRYTELDGVLDVTSKEDRKHGVGEDGET